MPVLLTASVNGLAAVKFMAWLAVPEYRTLSVTVTANVPSPDEDGLYGKEIVLGESLTFFVYIVWPFKVKVTVPGNWAYWASVRGCVPWVTVAVMVQL